MAELLDSQSSRCVVALFVSMAAASSLSPRFLIFISVHIQTDVTFHLKGHLVETLQFLRRQALKFSTALEVSQEELKNFPEKKLLKVAIVGRPNAGKSTLINSLLKLNLCAASCKSHTTKTTFRVALTRGATQIVFVDTPGFVTKKEFARFKLSDGFLNWKDNVCNEADIIGILHEVTEPRLFSRFHLNLMQNINNFPQSKPLFLLFNKIDLILDKKALNKIVDSYTEGGYVENPDLVRVFNPKVMAKFSKVFFISALKDRGVSEVADYLFEQAKPGEWLFHPDRAFHEPLHLIVRDLLRAKLLDVLPSEVPYNCEYEVEYLKKNPLGEIICVCLISCGHPRYIRLINSGKRFTLGKIAKEMESDLFKIVGSVFKIRLEVYLKSRKMSYN